MSNNKDIESEPVQSIDIVSKDAADALAALSDGGAPELWLLGTGSARLAVPEEDKHESETGESIRAADLVDNGRFADTITIDGREVDIRLA